MKKKKDRHRAKDIMTELSLVVPEREKVRAIRVDGNSCISVRFVAVYMPFVSGEKNSNSFTSNYNIF